MERAPIEQGRLEQEMGSLSCADVEVCPLERCFTDRHHLIWGEGLSEATKMLKSHPDFIIPDVCRAVHLQIHKRWKESERPGDQFAIGYLVASPLNLSANKRRQLNELRKRK